MVIEYHQIKGTTLEALRTLHDATALVAFQQVTITGSGFEGGNALGQITFPQTDYLAAIQQLIRSLDPTIPPPLTQRVATSDFSYRMVET
ncbi:MAG: hypothetical protein B9S32_13910 [Verrucomicrobia bacterium Tous-C9LFEB]|nr:MAG: hypothetical protein B9S32_13910 [Verrucomicrobia bacterium Tous-C9LFEB]